MYFYHCHSMSCRERRFNRYCFTIHVHVVKIRRNSTDLPQARITCAFCIPLTLSCCKNHTFDVYSITIIVITCVAYIHSILTQKLETVFSAILDLEVNE